MSYNRPTMQSPRQGTPPVTTEGSKWQTWSASQVDRTRSPAPVKQASPPPRHQNAYQPQQHSSYHKQNPYKKHSEPPSSPQQRKQSYVSSTSNQHNSSALNGAQENAKPAHEPSSTPNISIKLSDILGGSVPASFSSSTASSNDGHASTGPVFNMTIADIMSPSLTPASSSPARSPAPSPARSPVIFDRPTLKAPPTTTIRFGDLCANGTKVDKPNTIRLNDLGTTKPLSNESDHSVPISRSSSSSTSTITSTIRLNDLRSGSSLSSESKPANTISLWDTRPVSKNQNSVNEHHLNGRFQEKPQHSMLGDRSVDAMAEKMRDLKLFNQANTIDHDTRNPSKTGSLVDGHNPSTKPAMTEEEIAPQVYSDDIIADRKANAERKLRQAHNRGWDREKTVPRF
ncbi:hypothetical protein F4703DRAFT_1860783 [Phycomyces blakesleeanus]